MAAPPSARRQSEPARPAKTTRRAAAPVRAAISMSRAAAPSPAAARPHGVRSGEHLEPIGETWYYRRVVPPDARPAFEWDGKKGRTKVKFSLGTKSKTEARRLEKEHDVEFERRLAAARAIQRRTATLSILASAPPNRSPRSFTRKIVVRRSKVCRKPIEMKSEARSKRFKIRSKMMSSRSTVSG